MAVIIKNISQIADDERLLFSNDIFYNIDKKLETEQVSEYIIDNVKTDVFDFYYMGQNTKSSDKYLLNNTYVFIKNKNKCIFIGIGIFQEIIQERSETNRLAVKYSIVKDENFGKIVEPSKTKTNYRFNKGAGDFLNNNYTQDNLLIGGNWCAGIIPIPVENINMYIEELLETK